MSAARLLSRAVRPAALPRVPTLARALATPVKTADPITKTSTLSNGLSVVSETIPGASTSTVGLWIDAGSRADAQNASGTAHFLEVC
jgi:processing peptidase subunit beta